MTAETPLFSFMPYGAPELLRDGRRDLFRATVASSFASGIALLLLAAVAQMVVDRDPATRTIVDPGHFVSPRPNTGRSEPQMRYRGPRPPSNSGSVIPIRDLDGVEDDAVEEPGSFEDLGPMLPDTSEGEGVVPPALPPPPIEVPTYVDELPVPIVEPRPEYPELAKDAGIEGTVLVHVFVSREGRVVSVLASERQTVPLLESSALDAARRWVFRPAISNGHAVAVWVAIPFEFRLR